MGNRGKPRGVPSTPADNLLPTGSRRTSTPGGGRTRAERRKLQRKVKRKRRRSAVREIPLLVGVAVLIALVLKTFLVQAFVIPSGSMEQTIRIGDRVLVDKFTPWFGSKPQRGDVVVFHDPGGWLADEQTAKKHDPVVVKQVKEGLTFIGLLPSDNEKDLIKRVIGVGGDHVKCCDAQGRVTVNGVPLTEADYLYPGNNPSSTPFDITVPKGRLWVMGDHRDNSADSRATRTPRTAARSPRTPWSAVPWSSAGPSATGPASTNLKPSQALRTPCRGRPRPLRCRIGLPPTIRTQ